MGTDAEPTVQDFAATLHFDAEPGLDEAALIEAWGREGYECERAAPGGVFHGFRGSTYVLVGTPKPTVERTIPAPYPAVALAPIDWTKTFCIDHKAGFDDLHHATHEAAFNIRVLADPAQPLVAHNEIAATLLGIHQTAPLRAVTLHYLDTIVGRSNLDDYLNYANSNLDKPAQSAPMLAFGTFATQGESAIRAWTSGLGHFGQRDFVLDGEAFGATDALLAVFGFGYQVLGGRRFRAGERFTSLDLRARFEDDTLNGQPALRVVPQERQPA